jgi:DNA-binding CsgD family transcriptional regulator
MTRAVGELIEAARSACSVEAFERVLFAVLDREIGFDVAFCVRAEGPGPFAPGLEPVVRRDAEGSWPRFGAELTPLCRAASTRGGVEVDVEFFGARKLERMAHYQQLMRPHRGRSSLIGYLPGADAQLIGSVVLGRTTPRFAARERRRLQRALPLLSLCELALRPLHGSRLVQTLTAREREVLGYLQLGYSNPQIARACGTAARTVRNQLSAIFVKLGAASRAEAVALSLGHH